MNQLKVKFLLVSKTNLISRKNEDLLFFPSGNKVYQTIFIKKKWKDKWSRIYD